MTPDQIDAHEEAGEFMHMPTEERRFKKRTARPGEYSQCKICGAEIVASVIKPGLWLEA